VVLDTISYVLVMEELPKLMPQLSVMYLSTIFGMLGAETFATRAKEKYFNGRLSYREQEV